MQKTALNDWHSSNGATMTDFHGWNMPLYYKGITQEHLHTREKAGIFDLGHMGRVFIRGENAQDFVNWLTPARVSEAKPGDIHYSFFLRPDGTVIDDITVYYEDQDILLVINAGNRERDLAWIREKAGQFGRDVEIDDKGDTWGMIALQGPLSREILQPLLGDEITSLNYYQFIKMNHPSYPGEMVISRTGYTGEDGFEIYLPTENVAPLWQAIVAAGPEGTVMPVGLGARDSLRLEASMPLYGHELDDSLTPLHAGLGKFVDLEKGEFIGKEALADIKAQGGPSERLAGFEMAQRGPIPRQGFTIVDSDGNAIGRVTSGIFSPSLQKTVGLAYLQKEHSTIGNSISIDIRGRALPATIIKRPFYRRNAG